MADDAATRAARVALIAQLEAANGHAGEMSPYTLNALLSDALFHLRHCGDGEDGARLDWLEKQKCGPIFKSPFYRPREWGVYDFNFEPSWKRKWHYAKTLRAAIDAAREASDE